MANAASQATGLATTFQTPLAVAVGIILFSIGVGIAITLAKRAHRGV